MVNTLLYQSLPNPGSILYLPKADELDLLSLSNANLPDREAFDHPVIVLHVDASERLASILIVTSFGGHTLEQKHGHNSRVVREYMPIDPARPQGDGKILKLQGGETMKKASWVRLTPVYKVPASVLVHGIHLSRNLTPESYNMLVRAVGGKSSPSATIYHAVQANRVSQPVNYHDGWAVYPQAGTSSQSRTAIEPEPATRTRTTPYPYSYSSLPTSHYHTTQQSALYHPVAKFPRRGPLGQQRLWERADEESGLLDSFWSLPHYERSVTYWRAAPTRRASLRERFEHHGSVASRFFGNLLIVAVCIGVLWGICLGGVQVVSAVRFLIVSAMTYWKHVANVISVGFTYAGSAMRSVAEFVGTLLERLATIIKGI